MNQSGSVAAMLCLLLEGCSRAGFVAAASDAATDLAVTAIDGHTTPDTARSDSEVRTDTSAPCEAGRWSDWTTPKMLLDANDAVVEGWAPSISADSLELYVARSTDDSYDLWVSRRASLAERFGESTPIPELVTPTDKRSPSIAAAGLMLLFRSEEPASHRGEDIYQTSRSDRTSPFVTPEPLASLNSAADDSSPWSRDGLAVYFRSTRSGGQGGNDIYVATRPSTHAGFDSIAPVEGINSTDDDEGPTLSADGLEIFFESDRAGGLGRPDIYRATRPDASSPFGVPANVTALNTPDDETDPALSSDGRTIYFNRGDTDEVWVATRTCLANP